MDKEIEIQLREWEQRYESYRAYRSQYLTALSICASGYIIGISLVTGLDIPGTVRTVVFAVMLVGLILLGIAHMIALKATRILGERMAELQHTLGMTPFDSTWLLRSSLRVSLVGTGVLTIITLIVVLYFQLQGG